MEQPCLLCPMGRFSKRVSSTLHGDRLAFCFDSYPALAFWCVQHISAGAINETARLVDLVGTGTGTGGRSATVSPLATAGLSTYTPPRASRHQQASTRNAVAVLDYLPTTQVN